MNQPTLTYYGTVAEDGKISLPGEQMRKEVRVFAGKEIVVTIRRARKHRTSPQNRYYHGVVVERIRQGLADMGDPLFPEQVHEMLKMQFLRRQKTDEHGELLYEYTESTASLNTVEFTEYLEKCIRFAAEFLGEVIPPPPQEGKE